MRPIGSPGRVPSLSVVIPTYRRPELLRRCLEAVLAQTLEPREFEVIVVDDGHDERTRNTVGSLAEATPGGPSLRYLRPAHGRGPAVARNAGWRAARGALVAFTDDDTIPAVDWLAQGRRAMERPTVEADAPAAVRTMDAAAQPAPHAWRGDASAALPAAAQGEGGAPPLAAVCGRVEVPLTATPPTDHERMTQGLETAEFVTANAFVRREALMRVGGFDERFTRAWREDSDLQFRLMREAGPVGRCEEAVVRHPVRAEPWGVCLRQQRNTFFDALLYKKHPRLYRERIRRRPPWNYYAIVALAFAVPLLLLAGLAPAAGAATLGAVAGVLLLAWQRLRHTARTPAHVSEMLATSALIPFLSVYWRLRGALHFRAAFL